MLSTYDVKNSRLIPGFTLIELMIAVTLGMMIIYVAVAGFRVAAQTLTVTNNLAMENAVLRAGCQLANERLDFWTDYDDPETDDNSKRLLRTTDGSGGAPFAPMSIAFPRVGNLATSEPEKKSGWDPKEPWKASDPRTWWRGNLAEKNYSDMRLGRYSIFGNSQPSVVVQGNPGTIGTYGTATVLHEWYNRQVWGMHKALGYYGFVDYMPQNTIFACNQEYVRKPPNGMWNDLFTNDDGVPLLLFLSGSTFDGGDGGQEYPKGLWRLTMSFSYAVVSPTNANARNPTTHRNKYDTGYRNVNAAGLRAFEAFQKASENKQVLLDGPSHWPTADVTVQHYVKTGRFVNLCKVQLLSPITGATTELVFTGFGTTLRGARQQRLHPSLGLGWADYDNKVGFTNRLTLDDTP